MEVEVDGTVLDCHCPTTGRIGDIVFRDIPCLLSRSKDTTRKTLYTVEAISLDLPSENHKSWILILYYPTISYINLRRKWLPQARLTLFKKKQ